MTDDTFAGHLLPGEQIVWSGRPKLGLLFTRRDRFYVPFSILWGGFILTVFVAALRPPVQLMALVWVSPFVIAALFLTVGRFVIDARLRSRTHYAITNHRVLIARAGMSPNVISIGTADLGAFQLYEERNGRGTIRFGRPRFFLEFLPRETIPSLDVRPQFLAIADANIAFDELERLVDRQESAAGPSR